MVAATGALRVAGMVVGSGVAEVQAMVVANTKFLLNGLVVVLVVVMVAAKVAMLLQVGSQALSRRTACLGPSQVAALRLQVEKRGLLLGEELMHFAMHRQVQCPPMAVLSMVAWVLALW